MTADLDSMTVKQLQSELLTRNLSKTGNKAILTQRLKEAIAAEEAGETAEAPAEAAEAPAEAEAAPEAEAEPMQAEEAAPEVEATVEEPAAATDAPAEAEATTEETADADTTMAEPETATASPSKPAPGSESCKLFVGSLDSKTTEETLKEHFGQFGEITVVVKKPTAHIAFVTFATKEAVDAALAHTDHTVDGRKLRPERARVQIFKLYVGAIPAEATEEQLREVLESYGTVTDLHIPLDKDTQKPRGFAFASFNSEEAADKLMNEKPGPKLLDKALEIKKAKPQTQGGKGSGKGGFMNYGGNSYGGGYGSPSRRPPFPPAARYSPYHMPMPMMMMGSPQRGGYGGYPRGGGGYGGRGWGKR